MSSVGNVEKRSDKGSAAGCVVAILHLAIVIPLWFTLLWSILDSINAKPWQWGILYGYYVGNFCLNALSHTIKVMEENPVK